MQDPDGLQGRESLPTLRAELTERSKELGFLHHATRLIHMHGEPRDILRAVLEFLPSAMCYPELAGARLCLGSLEIRTRGYEQSELSLRAEFSVEGEGDHRRPRRRPSNPLSWRRSSRCSVHWLSS